GAMSFDDMGPSWVPVREAVAAGTLRVNDTSASEGATRFDALIRFACLRLGRQLGTEVMPALSRQELAKPSLRSTSLTAALVKDGVLRADIRIPNTVSNLHVEADLRASKVTCSFDLDSPREGRA